MQAQTKRDIQPVLAFIILATIVAIVTAAPVDTKNQLVARTGQSPGTPGGMRSVSFVN